MNHNKKIIIGSIAAVAILTAAFVSCQTEKPAGLNLVIAPVKIDSVVSPILSDPVMPDAIPYVNPENAVQANSVSTAPISITEGRMERKNHIIKVPASAVEKKVSLHRIDFSGIYALPENVQANQVKQVFLDGVTARYTITENGNLDVIESQLKSAVTAVLK